MLQPDATPESSTPGQAEPSPPSEKAPSTSPTLTTPLFQPYTSDPPDVEEASVTGQVQIEGKSYSFDQCTAKFYSPPITYNETTLLIYMLRCESNLAEVLSGGDYNGVGGGLIMDSETVVFPTGNSSPPWMLSVSTVADSAGDSYKSVNVYASTQTSVLPTDYSHLHMQLDNGRCSFSNTCSDGSPCPTPCPVCAPFDANGTFVCTSDSGFPWMTTV